MYINRIIIALFLFCLSDIGQAQTEIDRDLYAQPATNRSDGRFISTYGIVHNMLKEVKPKYAFKEGMSHEEFNIWKLNVRNAMAEIMKFPEISGQPEPKKISTQPRSGYILEKWEFYPFPNSVSTFLVLKPQNLNYSVPGILCFPGSGRTKEGLAGEKGIEDKFTENYQSPKVAMALEYVKQGYVAVAVDNAAAGEASDLEKFYYGSNYDYDTVSRILLEMGWNWLGYTSYLDKLVLDWMKNQDYIDQSKIVLSGFSLGTEPMMVLGVLDPDIYAFIYNDFLCQTQERALVMTKPNEKGRRGFPNSIRHLIPNYWNYFNFPDVVASLAPRPIILTEGGLDRDFNLLKSAYKLSGFPQNLTFYHYPKFADKERRHDFKTLPSGIDRDRFFELANVDPPAHYLKYELIIPWLNKILKK